MSESALLGVTVACSPAAGQVDLVRLSLPAGSTLADALLASGLLEREKLALVGYRITELDTPSPWLYNVRANLRDEVQRIVVLGRLDEFSLACDCGQASAGIGERVALPEIEQGLLQIKSAARDAGVEIAVRLYLDCRLSDDLFAPEERGRGQVRIAQPRQQSLGSKIGQRLAAFEGQQME